MKSETFTQAHQIQTRITALEFQLKEWNNAESFSQNGVKLMFKDNRAESFWVQPVDGSFEVLKAIVIQKLTSQLNDLKAQFDAL